MERRPHPTYDRVTLRRTIGWVAVALGVPTAAIAGLPPLVGGEWAGVVAVGGFGVGVAGVLMVPVNRFPCPECGRPLRRRFYARAFECPDCDVAWVTRGHGFSVREGP